MKFCEKAFIEFDRLIEKYLCEPIPKKEAKA